MNFYTIRKTLQSLPLRILFLGFRHLILAGVAIFLFFHLISPNIVNASPRFGLWVEAEGIHQPFRSNNDFRSFSRLIEETSFTDFYCQIFRRGRSWFPSIVADDTPYREALSDGVDPLRDTIDLAHQRNKRVHAWINTLRVKDNANAPIFKIVGKKAALVDVYGNSLLDYNSKGQPPKPDNMPYSLDTPGIWLDPSVPQVRNYLKAVIVDLVTTYPDLDGIHLDMIRFPFAVGIGQRSDKSLRPGFGHSKEAMASVSSIISRLNTQSGIGTPQELNDKAWASWRMANVTLLVTEIRQLLNQIAPGMEFSVAALGNASTAKMQAFQNWPRWLNEGIIDTALPMVYTRDTAVVAQQSRYATSIGKYNKVMIGLGAWLMLNKHDLLLAQVKEAIQADAKGIVLFSYSNLHSKIGKELTKKVALLLANEQK